MGYTLIIDNYDSFTWNVYADIAVLGGNPLVKRNDKITIDEIQVRAIVPPSGGPDLQLIQGRVLTRRRCLMLGIWIE